MSDDEQNLMETLLDDFVQRLRRGESPSVAQYEAAHPTYAEEIRRTFPSVQMIEKAAQQWKRQRSLVSASCPPEQLGDYRIIREIGRGGMGVVYEAEQVSLRRRVALKLLPRELLAEPEQASRFEREAQTAAKLHHTNIVPVFGVGQDEGYHYYVMQLIEGMGLDNALAMSCHNASPAATFCLPGFDIVNESDYWSAVAHIGIQAADALAYAHAQGTLHRDIKPANLLLDEQGVVWITDFGLTRAIEQDGTGPQGAVAGTLRYMAPEQLSGQAEARSDIYGLGLTLYELLAMQPAYGETDPSKLVRRITQSPPDRLRTVNPRVPRDLDTIVAKATAHTLEDRYASADELAHDLRCYLDDRPIRARRATSVEHLWRWTRRNPVVAALSAASVTLLLVIAGLSTLGYLQLRSAYHQVDEALTEARKSEGVARAAAERAQHERDRALWENQRAKGNLTIAVSALDEIADRLASRELPHSVQMAVDDSAPVQFTGGLSPEDAELLQSLITFYDDFAANNAADTAVDQAAARVYRRIGDIRVRLGQYQQAVSAFDRALKIDDEIRRAEPVGHASLLFRAQTLNSLGKGRRLCGDFPRAIEAHRRAQEELENATLESDDKPALHYELGLTLNELVVTRSAQLMHELSRRGPRRPRQEPDAVAPPEIFDEYQLACDLLSHLIQDDPANRDYLLSLARCYRSILPVAWANGDDDLARTAKQRSIALLQQMVATAQDDSNLHYELADTLAMTVPADARTPLSEVDVADLTQSVGITTRLNAQYPTAHEFAFLLANSHHQLGLHFIANKDWTTANDHLTKAAGLLDSLVLSLPGNPLVQVSLAHVRWQWAESLRRQGSAHQAREVLEKAIRAYEAFRDSEAGRKTSPGLLVGLYRQLARTLEQLGETQAAEAASATADGLRTSPSVPRGPVE